MDDSGQLFLLLRTTAAAFTVAINTRELSTNFSTEVHCALQSSCMRKRNRNVIIHNLIVNIYLKCNNVILSVTHDTFHDATFRSSSSYLNRLNNLLCCVVFFIWSIKYLFKRNLFILRTRHEYFLVLNIAMIMQLRYEN